MMRRLIILHRLLPNSHPMSGYLKFIPQTVTFIHRLVAQQQLMGFKSRYSFANSFFLVAIPQKVTYNTYPHTYAPMG